MSTVTAKTLKAEEVRALAERFGYADALPAASRLKIGDDVLNHGDGHHPAGLASAYVLNPAGGELTLLEFAEAWGWRGVRVTLPTADRAGVAAAHRWIHEHWHNPTE